MQQKKKSSEKAGKQKIFDNLFNMAYESVTVDKKINSAWEEGGKKMFPTIFSALNNADEHIMIKINPGIYNQRLQIKKKDLKIQASQISQNTILVCQQHPNILVDLPQQSDKVFFQSLKMINCCQNSSRREQPQPSYQSLRSQNYMNYKIDIGMNTCLYIKRGIVQLEECKISQAAYHNRASALPCIVVQKEGSLILNRSEVRGGAGTIGIFSNGGRIIIKESVIKDHGVIGLFYSHINLEHPILTVKNCTFLKCKEGVTLNGPFESIIESNNIRDCDETGIATANGNRSQIVNNEIKDCKIGIKINNSYPTVLKNSISNNDKWGCKIRSSRGVLCKPTLKFNSINENSQGGILIEGPNNNCNIYSNQLKFNNLQAIKVCNQASPHIFMNKIFKTLGNGVYVGKGCSVFLEKNQIQASLKCNLLLEGPDNINSFIFRNLISKGRGEGILSFSGERLAIKENQIRENYNGIVSLTGVESIQENIIIDNQRNGILLVRDNNVFITGNELQGNKKAGIFIRDSSVGRIEENVFKNNKTEIIIENDDRMFHNIETTNFFDENYDIRVPSNYRCQLI